MKKKRPLEQLWAPWRMEYILEANRADRSGCIFCDRLKAEEDKKNLILYRGKEVFVIMNRYPYNSGHLMVVPNQHTGNLQEIEPEVNREMMETIQLCLRVLDKTMHPQGYNIGMNLGHVAGAGVEDHLHFHVVPRWNGDTNFMPVIANTKVISEALDKTYEKLKVVFEELTEAEQQ